MRDNILLSALLLSNPVTATLLCVVISFVCLIFYFLWELVCESLHFLSAGRQLSIGGYRISETTPLIAARELPFAESQRHTQPDYESFAIDIDGIAPTDIEQGALVGDLPRHRVRLPVGDISKVAVLSWRWDQDSEGRSYNLASAIKYSRSAGIRYLFADVVSIDQALGSAELISKVMAFSILYSTIPVIAAYDLEESRRHDELLDRNRGLRMTMARPWILKEIRLFAQNPTKLVYVGHNKQGACVSLSASCYLLGRPPMFAIQRTNFAEELAWAWTTDFGTCILNLLNGTSNITNVSDFKFILPAFVDVFTKAEELYRNDYLMTVSLLASTSSYGKDVVHAVEGTFTRLAYVNYQIESYIREGSYEVSVEGGDVTIEEYEEVHTVFLKPSMQGVAEFRFYRDNYKQINPSGRYHFTKYKSADRDICDMLGLGATEYETYITQEQERVACLRPPRVSPRQELDVVTL